MLVTRILQINVSNPGSRDLRGPVKPRDDKGPASYRDSIAVSRVEATFEECQYPLDSAGPAFRVKPLDDDSVVVLRLDRGTLGRSHFRKKR